ncbi:MAG: Development-specific protein S [Candidatus Ordinivivax streblomastigis]|uniref:Development-specific protein S n=1 Tax=Candidatus Ordinivivax streblomastigis TaxID=2540710 RepID=A0A5M8P3U9_9BACT|nr:MAG: Development-specific protein S [Candidatus Ordinivivax streblomastigis]
MPRLYGGIASLRDGIASRDNKKGEKKMSTKYQMIGNSKKSKFVRVEKGKSGDLLLIRRRLEPTPSGGSSIRVFLISFLFVLMAISDCMAQSGVYVGGHIRRERPATITKLKASGFQYVILFNVHVEPDGSLTTDGDTICRGGEYVFAKKQPYYVSDIKSLKTPPTAIEWIEICIGGWGNTSYGNIKQIVNSTGIGANGVLYKNFKALKEAIPEIDAVNNDDEHAYDVNSAVAFHLMMDELGYKTTLAPYTQKSYWSNLINGINQARTGVVERVLIQCYDGGAGNNPSDWHIAGIPLHAGRLNYQDFAQTKTVMQDWKTNKNVTGGFFWVYNDETWDLNKYATAVNRIFGAARTTDAPVATFYEEYEYLGYAVSFPEGSFHTADMAAYGLTNNDASSIKINPGYEVTIYDNDNFGGKSYVFDSDINSLSRLGNNTASSIRIAKKPTAIPAVENENSGIRLYPNPATDYISVLGIEKEATVQIFDRTGREVTLGNRNGAQKINISALPKGIYLVKTEKFVGKFVKE